MNPYEKLLLRKRTWTPVQPTKGKLKQGAEETIYVPCNTPYGITSWRLHIRSTL